MSEKPSTTTYDFTSGTLIGAFTAAVTRINLAAWDGEVRQAGREEAERNELFLRGVLLARLEGVKPPMNRGDTVRPKGDIEAKTRVIHRTYYIDGAWQLSFADSGDARFLADRFELVSTD